MGAVCAGVGVGRELGVCGACEPTPRAAGMDNLTFTIPPLIFQNGATS